MNTGIWEMPFCQLFVAIGGIPCCYNQSDEKVGIMTTLDFIEPIEFGHSNKEQTCGASAVKLPMVVGPWVMLGDKVLNNIWKRSGKCIDMETVSASLAVYDQV